MQSYSLGKVDCLAELIALINLNIPDLELQKSSLTL